MPVPAAKDTFKLAWLHANLRLGQSRDVALAGWLILAVLCGFLAYIARLHEITHDVFHEMALFREYLALGNFPIDDVFAYTPTNHPTVHHEWGTGAILYWATVESGLGLMGLSALRLLLIASLWLLLYRVARQRGAHPYVFALTAAITFPVFWVGFSMLRAQLFTLVFLAATMWMIEIDRRGRRSWVLAWWILLVAWLNIHAGFLVGVGMLAFHGMERLVLAWVRSRSLGAAVRETWHLIFLGAAIPLALPLNPYGWQYVPYLWHAVSMPRPLIREWHPLWHALAPHTTIPLFMISVLLIAYALRHNRKQRWIGAAFLLLCAYQALKHIRHGSLYATVWIAYVPAWLSRTPFGKHLVRRVDQHRGLVVRGSQFVIAASLAFACYHSFWRPTLPPAPGDSFTCHPTAAVQYLKQHNFRGNLLTQFNHGAYVSWELYPEVRVSLDGRYEVAYPPEVIESFHRLAVAADGWETVLEQYDTDAILIGQHTELRPKLEAFRWADSASTDASSNAQRWRFVYEDDAFVILAKPGTELPYVNRVGKPLLDGAWGAFSVARSHRARATGSLGESRE